MAAIGAALTAAMASTTPRRAGAAEGMDLGPAAAGSAQPVRAGRRAMEIGGLDDEAPEVIRPA